MRSMLGMCFNWKILLGLGLFAVGLFFVAPGMALAALPLLILAVCPLSMLWMMLMMRGGMSHKPGAAEAQAPGLAQTPAPAVVEERS